MAKIDLKSLTLKLSKLSLYAKMDEKALKALIADVKSSLLAQVKETEKAIKESLKSEIKDTEKSIRQDIDSIKNEVAVNKSEIEILKTKVKTIEENNKAGASIVVDDVKKKDDTDDEITRVMAAARCRIGLKPITLEDIEEVAEKAQVNGVSALREAVREFLLDELKLDDEELDRLGDYEVSRKDVDDNDKVYLKFDNEEATNYIIRKAAMVRNDNVTVFPFIPPQLYARFADLSKYTFYARHADKTLKTKISLGRRDLVLKTKIKDKTDWVTQEDLHVFGVLSDWDSNVMWPVMDIKEITSPPKGRKRKNVHDLSNNSEADKESPTRKRSRSAQDVLDDPENQKKVAAFVMDLEKKNGSRKFTQSKIKFASLKNFTQ